jgi:tetratricopeptide (TPR) repeat protein
LPHLTQDENLVSMFIDEAKVAAMITHQNVVQIYDLGSMEDTYYITMEYIHGKDLRNIMDKSQEIDLPLSTEHAIYVTCRICAGLDYSHNLKDFEGNPLNLIHRDISPPNILISYEGEVKIADFGIVKAARRSSDTEAGLIKGKLSYMSPEQAAGKSIDHRSDIFSTGILLYELVTGKRMYEGPEFGTLDQVRNAEFEPPESSAPDLPPQLYKILHRALAKDPQSRYQTCAEMLTELEECLSSFAVRPSAEALSQYMKRLFQEEIAADVIPLKGPDVGLSPEEPEEAEEKTETQEMEEGPPDELATGPAATRRKRRLLLGVWGGALAIIAMFLGLLFQEKPVPEPNQDSILTSTHRPEPAAASKEMDDSPQPAVPEAPTIPGTEALNDTNPSIKSGESRPSKLHLAMMASNKKQYERAVALFEETLANQPTERPKIAPSYAQALRGRAAGLLKSNPQQAEALLIKAVELDPDNVDGHFYLGKLYTSLKDYPSAIKAYGKTAELAPNFSDGFFNLGFVCTVTRNYPKAEEMFRKVIQLKPSYLDEAYFNLAVVQNLQGKRQESIRTLERAVEVNPDNERAKRYLLRFKQTSQNRDDTTQMSHKKSGTRLDCAATDLCWLRYD